MRASVLPRLIIGFQLAVISLPACGGGGGVGVGGEAVAVEPVHQSHDRCEVKTPPASWGVSSQILHLRLGGTDTHRTYHHFSSGLRRGG